MSETNLLQALIQLGTTVHIQVIKLPYIPDYKATGYIRQPPIFEGKKFGFELLSLY